MPDGSHHRELDVSRSWAEGRFPGELRLVDGRRIQIVYRGVWSNSNGPDFQGAMISIDGKLHIGSVEIHLRSTDWYRHGHDRDPAYNDVILHVVLNDDSDGTVRTSAGTAVPTLDLHGALDIPACASSAHEQAVFDALGTRTCLPTLVRQQPDLVRGVLRERGWSRMVEKQLRFGQELQKLTAPEVLYRGILDALGYSANREPMKMLGEALPLQLLERFARSSDKGAALAALLGTGGFLPLSPSIHSLCQPDGDAARLEERFAMLRDAYALQPVAPTSWSLNRVRPANHPAARLASLASIIDGASGEGLFAQFMSLPLDGGESWDRWLAAAHPRIGDARRRQIVVNILAPFVAAYAELTRDDVLTEQVAELWESLPGSVSDRIARRTRTQIAGPARFPVRLALEEQGLHDIHRKGCAQLRCFECPIARLAVEYEPLTAEVTEK